MMVVDHPSLAQALKIAFTSLWEQGLTFDEASVEHDLGKTGAA